MEVETIDLTDPLEQLCKQNGWSSEEALEKLELLKQGHNIDNNSFVIDSSQNDKVNEVIELLSDEEDDPDQSVEFVNVNLVNDDEDNSQEDNISQESTDFTEVHIVECYERSQENSDASDGEDDDDFFEEETGNRRESLAILEKDDSSNSQSIIEKSPTPTIENEDHNFKHDSGTTNDNDEQDNNDCINKKSLKNNSTSMETDRVDSDKLDDAIEEQILDYEDQLITAVKGLHAVKEDTVPENKLDQPETQRDEIIESNKTEEQDATQQEDKKSDNIPVMTEIETDHLSENLSIGDMSDSENNSLIQNIIDNLNSDDAFSTDNFDIDHPDEHLENISEGKPEESNEIDSVNSLTEKNDNIRNESHDTDESYIKNTVTTATQDSENKSEETHKIQNSASEISSKVEEKIGSHPFTSHEINEVFNRLYKSMESTSKSSEIDSQILSKTNNEESSLQSLLSQNINEHLNNFDKNDTSKDAIVYVSEAANYNPQVQKSVIDEHSEEIGQYPSRSQQTDERPTSEEPCEPECTTQQNADNTQNKDTQEIEIISELKQRDFESSALDKDCTKCDIVEELEAMLALDIDTTYKLSRNKKDVYSKSEQVINKGNSDDSNIEPIKDGPVLTEETLNVVLKQNECDKFKVDLAEKIGLPSTGLSEPKFLGVIATADPIKENKCDALNVSHSVQDQTVEHKEIKRTEANFIVSNLVDKDDDILILGDKNLYCEINDQLDVNIKKAKKTKNTIEHDSKVRQKHSHSEMVTKEQLLHKDTLVESLSAEGSVDKNFLDDLAEANNIELVEEIEDTYIDSDKNILDDRAKANIDLVEETDIDKNIQEVMDQKVCNPEEDLAINNDFLDDLAQTNTTELVEDLGSKDIQIIAEFADSADTEIHDSGSNQTEYSVSNSKKFSTIDTFGEIFADDGNVSRGKDTVDHIFMENSNSCVNSKDCLGDSENNRTDHTPLTEDTSVKQKVTDDELKNVASDSKAKRITVKLLKQFAIGKSNETTTITSHLENTDDFPEIQFFTGETSNEKTIIKNKLENTNDSMIRGSPETNASLQNKKAKQQTNTQEEEKDDHNVTSVPEDTDLDLKDTESKELCEPVHMREQDADKMMQDNHMNNFEKSVHTNLLTNAEVEDIVSTKRTEILGETVKKQTNTQGLGKTRKENLQKADDALLTEKVSTVKALEVKENINTAPTNINEEFIETCHGKISRNMREQNADEVNKNMLQNVALINKSDNYGENLLIHAKEADISNEILENRSTKKTATKFDEKVGFSTTKKTTPNFDDKVGQETSTQKFIEISDININRSQEIETHFDLQNKIASIKTESYTEHNAQDLDVGNKIRDVSGTQRSQHPDKELKQQIDMKETIKRYEENLKKSEIDPIDTPKNNTVTNVEFTLQNKKYERGAALKIENQQENITNTVNLLPRQKESENMEILEGISVTKETEKSVIIRLDSGTQEIVAKEDLQKSSDVVLENVDEVLADISGTARPENDKIIDQIPSQETIETDIRHHLLITKNTHEQIKQKNDLRNATGTVCYKEQSFEPDEFNSSTDMLSTSVSSEVLQDVSITIRTENTAVGIQEPVTSSTILRDAGKVLENIPSLTSSKNASVEVVDIEESDKTLEKANQQSLVLFENIHEKVDQLPDEPLEESESRVLEDISSTKKTANIDVVLEDKQKLSKGEDLEVSEKSDCVLEVVVPKNTSTSITDRLLKHLACSTILENIDKISDNRSGVISLSNAKEQAVDIKESVEFFEKQYDQNLIISRNITENVTPTDERVEVRSSTDLLLSSPKESESSQIIEDLSSTEETENIDQGIKLLNDIQKSNQVSDKEDPKASATSERALEDVVSRNTSMSIADRLLKHLTCPKISEDADEVLENISKVEIPTNAFLDVSEQSDTILITSENSDEIVEQQTEMQDTKKVDNREEKFKSVTVHNSTDNLLMSSKEAEISQILEDISSTNGTENTNQDIKLQSDAPALSGTGNKDLQALEKNKCVVSKNTSMSIADRLLKHLTCPKISEDADKVLVNISNVASPTNAILDVSKQCDTSLITSESSDENVEQQTEMQDTEKVDNREEVFKLVKPHNSTDNLLMSSKEAGISKILEDISSTNGTENTNQDIKLQSDTQALSGTGGKDLQALEKNKCGVSKNPSMSIADRLLKHLTCPKISEDADEVLGNISNLTSPTNAILDVSKQSDTSLITSENSDENVEQQTEMQDTEKVDNRKEVFKSVKVHNSTDNLLMSSKEAEISQILEDISSTNGTENANQDIKLQSDTQALSGTGDKDLQALEKNKCGVSKNPSMSIADRLLKHLTCPKISEDPDEVLGNISNLASPTNAILDVSKQSDTSLITSESSDENVEQQTEMQDTEKVDNREEVFKSVKVHNSTDNLLMSSKEAGISQILEDISSTNETENTNQDIKLQSDTQALSGTGDKDLQALEKNECVVSKNTSMSIADRLLKHLTYPTLLKTDKVLENISSVTSPTNASVDVSEQSDSDFVLEHLISKNTSGSITDRLLKHLTCPVVSKNTNEEIENISCVTSSTNSNLESSEQTNKVEKISENSDEKVKKQTETTLDSNGIADREDYPKKTNTSINDTLLVNAEKTESKEVHKEKTIVQDNNVTNFKKLLHINLLTNAAVKDIVNTKITEIREEKIDQQTNSRDFVETSKKHFQETDAAFPNSTELPTEKNHENEKKSINNLDSSQTQKMEEFKKQKSSSNILEVKGNMNRVTDEKLKQETNINEELLETSDGKNSGGLQDTVDLKSHTASSEKVSERLKQQNSSNGELPETFDGKNSEVLQNIASSKKANETLEQTNKEEIPIECSEKSIKSSYMFKDLTIKKTESIADRLLKHLTSSTLQNDEEVKKNDSIQGSNKEIGKEQEYGSEKPKILELNNTDQFKESCLQISTKLESEQESSESKLGIESNKAIYEQNPRPEDVLKPIDKHQEATEEIMCKSVLNHENSDDEGDSDNEEFKTPKDQEEIRRSLLLQLSSLRSRKNTGVLKGISAIPNETYEKHSFSENYPKQLKKNSKEPYEKKKFVPLNLISMPERRVSEDTENTTTTKVDKAATQAEHKKLTEEIKSILNEEMKATSEACARESDSEQNNDEPVDHAGVFEIVKNKPSKPDANAPKKTLKVKYTEEIPGPSWMDRPFRSVSNDNHFSNSPNEPNNEDIRNDFGFVIQSVTSVSIVDNHDDKSNSLSRDASEPIDFLNAEEEQNEVPNIINELRKIISKKKERPPKSVNEPKTTDTKRDTTIIEKISPKRLEKLKSLSTAKSNPFESNALDEFLTENSELHVSYDVPKSGAEEGIRQCYTEEDLLIPVYIKEDTSEDPEKSKGGPKIKARTLAEKRRLYEKNQRKLARQEEKAKKLQQNLKKCYVLFEDKQIFVKSHLVSKCLASINSSETPDVKSEERESSQGPRKLAPTTPRKQSLLRELYERNKPNFGYKAGPLSKKPQLQTNVDSWVTELKELPKVMLEIEGELGKPVPTEIIPYMPQSDGEMNDNQIEFALTALKTTEEPNKHPYSFVVPYKNNQTQILVRRRQEVEVFSDYLKHKDEKLTLEEEVAGVVNDLVDYVELKELAPSLIKEDEDCNYDIIDVKEDPSLGSGQLDNNKHLLVNKKKGRRKKNSKTNWELRRLNCKVVEVAVDQPPTDEDGLCEKPHCLLGCVCKSLSGESFIGLHCGKLKCMFGCSCPKENDKIHTVSQLNFPAGTDLFSTDTVSRIEDEAKRYLAKVERDFTQTVIQTGDKTIVVGFGSKPRRATRAPKKYVDYVDDPEEYYHKKVTNNLEILKSQMKPCCVEMEKFNFNDIMPYCLVHNLYNCYCKGRFKFINPDAPDESYVTTEKAPVKPVKKEKIVKKKDKLETKKKVEKPRKVDTPPPEDKDDYDENETLYSASGRPLRLKKKKKHNEFGFVETVPKPKPKDSQVVEDNIENRKISEEKEDEEENDIFKSARTSPIERIYKKLKSVTDVLFENDFVKNITQADLLKINLEKEGLSDSELLKISLIAEERRRINEEEKAAKKRNKRKQVLKTRTDDKIKLKKPKMVDGHEIPKAKIKPVFEGEIIVDDANWLEKFARNTRQQMDGYARILPWKAMLKGFLSRSLTVNCLMEMPLRIVLTLGINVMPDALNVETHADIILNTQYASKNRWCVGQTENVRDIVKWLTDCSLPARYNQTSLSFLLVEVKENLFEIRGLCTQTARQSQAARAAAGGSDGTTRDRTVSHSGIDDNVPVTSIARLDERRSSTGSTTSSGVKEVPPQIVVSDEETPNEPEPLEEKEDDTELSEPPQEGVHIVKHKDMFGTIRQMYLTKELFPLQELIEGSCINNADKNFDVTNDLYMWAALPQILNVGKWKMIPLNEPFEFLYFKVIRYSIKFIDLLKFTDLAKESNCTLVLKNKKLSASYTHAYKKLSASYTHAYFGIYVDQNYPDRIFIGPYFRQCSKDDIELVGATGNFSGHWLIERYSQTQMHTNAVERTIDLTEDDEVIAVPTTEPVNPPKPKRTRKPRKKKEKVTDGKLPAASSDTSTSKTPTVDITKSPVNNPPPSPSSVNVSMDMYAEEEQTIYHQGVAINIKNSVPKAPSEYNRFIITNIPRFGYLGAYQPEFSETLEVSWPFEKKVLQFKNKDCAKNFLQERFTQLLQPVPESFQIQVLVLNDLQVADYEPVNSDFLSGHCVCGPFGIYNFRELTDSFCQHVLNMSKQHITMLFAKRAQTYIKKKIEELAEIIHLSRDDMVKLGVNGILDKAVEQIKLEQNLRVHLLTDIEIEEKRAVQKMKRLYELMAHLPVRQRNIECKIFQDILKIRPQRAISSEVVEILDDDEDSNEQVTDDRQVTDDTSDAVFTNNRTGSIILPNTMPEEEEEEENDVPFVTPTITNVTSLAEEQEEDCQMVDYDCHIVGSQIENKNIPNPTERTTDSFVSQKRPIDQVDAPQKSPPKKLVLKKNQNKNILNPTERATNFFISQKRPIDQVDAPQTSPPKKLVLKKKQFLIDDPDPVPEKTALQQTLPALKPLPHRKSTTKHSVDLRSIPSSERGTCYNVFSKNTASNSVLISGSSSVSTYTNTQVSLRENDDGTIVYAFTTPSSTSREQPNKQVGSIILPNTPPEEEDDIIVPKMRIKKPPKAPQIVVQQVSKAPQNQPKAIQYPPKTLQNQSIVIQEPNKTPQNKPIVIQEPNKTPQNKPIVIQVPPDPQARYVHNYTTAPSYVYQNEKDFFVPGNVVLKTVNKPQVVTASVPKIVKLNATSPNVTSVLKTSKPNIVQAGSTVTATSGLQESFRIVRTNDGTFVLVGDNITNPPPNQTTVTNLVIQNNQIVSSETYCE